MKEWQDYSIEEIKTGTDKEGNRLVLSFCQDYKELFGKGATCCHTCPSFESKFRKYIQKANKMKDQEKCSFKLKAMYNGIQEKFGGHPVSNGNITDEKAIALLNSHPRGKDLFEEMPDNVDDLIKGNDGDSFEKKVKGMLKAELIKLSEELNLSSEGSVPELKKAIIENGPEPKEDEPKEDEPNEPKEDEDKG